MNFFLAGAVELPTYVFLWPAMDYWGRRWTLCVSMVIGGVACLTTFLVQNGECRAHQGSSGMSGSRGGNSQISSQIETHFQLPN
jgi:hypothetical protein